MSLIQHLKENKEKILQKWFEEILKTYPPETTQHLKKNNNPFANPIGHTLGESIFNIFEGILEERSPDELISDVDQIIKVRAVQDIKPSEAVNPVLLLKSIVRTEFEKIKNTAENREHYAVIDKIDHLILLSLDLYMESREKINEIKLSEYNRQYYRLIQRGNQGQNN
ncbi:MAG: RsbRD N-terminal domain-containing protein [SAR324 cluster bacterium]|nr:RsbRD N-terminal domain-containing protein [SAR324 cluster bacterium]